MGTGKLNTLFANFRRDEGGNFMMIFAFATAAIFLTVGLAVEFSHSINMKTRVTNSLDAATLATARALSIGEITEDQADDYLEAVFIANLGVDDLGSSDFAIENITINPVDKTVSARAVYDQDLKFISIGAAVDHQEVGSNSAATYGISDIEVAMVLDTTGSMGGSKITALKDAAEIGVEELLSVNTPTDVKVRISLIPYSYAVNTGPLAQYVYADFKEKKSDAPFYSNELFDDTGVGYDIDAFQETGNMDDMYANDDGTPIDDCATDRKAPNSGTSYQYSDANPSYGMLPRDSRLHTDWCPSAALMPLSSNESALKTRINSLNASGWTAGHIGLQWAWYTLSHDWYDYMPSGSKPGDPAVDDDLQKYVILMTDGEFNTAYADVKKKNWSAGSQGSKSRTHTENLCDNVKGDQIKIFTIGFQLYDSTALAMLKDCATPDDGEVTYHYEPETGEELKETYENIARTIQSLRLIQ
ncbi:pilus assembly protein [Nitratireductor sp. XY-223]|uniref:pilus assembly protein n=1 Tax=Nitratireductor sp. XY-223 TaxID=2561926 RepID=UPI0010A9A3A2|nr:pilus assembly protein [Nitratireductor sp. XY-223]